jgi:hypothetical protein
MRIAIKAIMCVSFVTGTYEAVVDYYEWRQRWHVGGDLREMHWQKFDSETQRMDEEEVRAIVSEEQWQKLMADDIIDCSIEMTLKEYFDKTKNL